ncbi:MAG TPA: outer membrane lipid asymmetry maintenance protein MlaD [Candidatus Omnitrophota bacterium]|nr:outer membrane lipid asymmetry maintenance protein MlaD [Candidatus Omnitrophota bacterium]
MGRNLIETIMGAVVLMVAGFFLVFAYRHADLEEVQGYELKAQFASVGGLDVGSDVRINGIKVGTVNSHALDPATFNAIVTMTIMPSIQLPQDTVATIATEGLLGGKFVKLEPGRAPDRIAAGGAIAHTKDFKSIEEMVGQLIFLATADQPQAAPAPAPAEPAPAPEPQQ